MFPDKKTPFVAFLSICLSASFPLSGTAATDLAGQDLTVTELDAGGYINSGEAAVLTIDIASDVSYAGSISGAISLVKKGNGVLTLTAPSPFKGTVRVEGGVLATQNAYLGNVTVDSNGTTVGGERITLANGARLRLTETCALSQRQLAVAPGDTGYLDIPNNINIHASATNLLFDGGTLVKTGIGTLTLANSGRFNDRDMTGSTLRCEEGIINPMSDVFGNASNPTTLTLEVLKNGVVNFRIVRVAIPLNCVLRGGTLTTIQRRPQYAKFERFALMMDYDIGSSVTVYPGEGNAVTSTIFALDGCHLVQKPNTNTVFDVREGAVLNINARLYNAYTKEDAVQGFTKRGTGTLLLSQPVCMNGPLSVEEGTVVFTRTSYLSSSATLAVSPGATVALDDGTILASPLEIADDEGAVTLTVPYGATAVYCNPGTSGEPESVRSVVKSGSGTLAWTGGNSGFTALRVGEGTLALRASNNLSRAAIWVDPSDAATLTHDDSDGTDRVVKLINKGSAGGAFIPSKNNNAETVPAPPYSATGINNLATLDFDGNSSLITTALDTSWQKERSLIVFFVFTCSRFESNTPYGPWNGPFSFSSTACKGDDSNYKYGFHLEQYPYTYNSNHALNIRGSSGGVNFRWDYVNLELDEPYIFVAIQRPRASWYGVECADDDSNNLPRFTNGLENANSPYPLNINRVSLGGRLSNGKTSWFGNFHSSNRMWFGKVGEFIAFDSDLAQEDMDATLAYLRKKWLNKGDGSATPPSCLTGHADSVPSFSSVRLSVADGAVLEHSAEEQTIKELSLESGSKITHTPPTPGSAIFNVTGNATLTGNLTYEGYPCPQDPMRLFSYGTLSLVSPVWTFTGSNVKASLHAYVAPRARAYMLTSKTGVIITIK